MATCVASSLVGDIILVRLLTAGKKPTTPSELRKGLEPFFAHSPDAEQWQAHVSDLVSAGMLTTRPYRLTETGRMYALGFLGLEALPKGMTWKTIQSRYLVPKALGVSTNTETAKQVSEAEGLRAYLLRDNYQLPVGTGASLTRVISALAFKELKFPDETNLAGLKAAALSRLLGSGNKLKMKEIEKQLPKKVLNANRSGADSLREAILRRWLNGSAEPEQEAFDKEAQPPKATAFDLPAFAATVVAAARDCPTGRFGENKVFINHVWRHLRHEPGVPQLDLADFKARLAEANHAGLLQLSRADLVQVMDPADVGDSETHYLNAVFHFVLI
jgi:hypothetical protein